VSDLEEFIRKHRPGTKRSRLFPHLPAIHRLRAEGFSFDQVCQYLGEKGVSITVSGLASFLKRHENIKGGEQGHVPTRGTAVPPKHLGDDISGDATPSATSPPELDGLDRKQRRERLADQFIKPETSNPLLKRMKENKA
jgi:hypothetical protein